MSKCEEVVTMMANVILPPEDENKESRLLEWVRAMQERAKEALALASRGVRYKVRYSNGDYPPSCPYDGDDKEIAIAVATAYIAQGKRATITEYKEGSEK